MLFSSLANPYPDHRPVTPPFPPTTTTATTTTRIKHKNLTNERVLLNKVITIHLQHFYTCTQRLLLEQYVKYFTIFYTNIKLVQANDLTDFISEFNTKDYFKCLHVYTDPGNNMFFLKNF